MWYWNRYSWSRDFTIGYFQQLNYRSILKLTLIVIQPSMAVRNISKRPNEVLLGENRPQSERVSSRFVEELTLVFYNQTLKFCDR